MNRELLEKLSSALEDQPGWTEATRLAVLDLRAHLAQSQGEPAWHPAPTCPGLWVGWPNRVYRIEQGDIAPLSAVSGSRWYGPIPQEQEP